MSKLPKQIALYVAMHAAVLGLAMAYTAIRRKRLG
jgi:hypothetical protein